jgi:hypothetical protein
MIGFRNQHWKVSCTLVLNRSLVERLPTSQLENSPTNRDALRSWKRSSRAIFSLRESSLNYRNRVTSRCLALRRHVTPLDSLGKRGVIGAVVLTSSMREACATRRNPIVQRFPEEPSLLAVARREPWLTLWCLARFDVTSTTLYRA